MDTAIQARDEMVDFLRRELIGPDPQPSYSAPDTGEEILRPQDPPRMRYGAGALFPRRSGMAANDSPSKDAQSAVATSESGPAEDDNTSDEGLQATGQGTDTSAQTDQEVNRANEYLPSAMGLSALLQVGGLVRVQVTAARYEQRTVVGIGRQDKNENWQPHWWRVPILWAEQIDTTAFAIAQPLVREYHIPTHGEKCTLRLHVFSRPHAQADDADRERIITFTLLNDNQQVEGRAADSDCFFQCSFSVECVGNESLFLDYPERSVSPDDEEEASLDLLYRHRRTFAVGHGCAADWLPERKVWTETMPTYEIQPIVPVALEGLTLSMRALSNKDSDEPLHLCRALAANYSDWIKLRESQEIPALPAHHQEAAKRHLKGCRKCLTRIEEGISLLSSDADTRLAFSWMNQAMLMQQLHYELASKKRRFWKPVEEESANTSEVEEPRRRSRGRAWTAMENRRLQLDHPYDPPNYAETVPDKGEWRPFQLAFILMNLDSMVRPESSTERALVDLVWFPTGGGKTEAYLGLTAFSIFRRRLRDGNNAGVTVLMRYTLRLLTTQQFQRAASLICACEKIRRENVDLLGREPISIGLWVGEKVTPTTETDAAAALGQMLRGEEINPFVMLACPWCGAQMGPVKTSPRSAVVQGYHRAGPPAKVVFACDDPDCEFVRGSGGLPLHVVDEAIYNHRPTLIIGTVDKFALLPWRQDARSLFGLNSGGMFSPPELIIQDELHLISGALGSMVGQYEGVLETLCTALGKDGRAVPPKIVASTATIRRAIDQVRSLYGREVFLFPPQGLEAGDSFFAKEDKYASGRRYVGVFGSALSSHVTAQIRVMSALLQSVKCLSTTVSTALDPYVTLMAYFNSLRELGHAATLVRADIREYMNAMWDRLNIRSPKHTPGVPDRRRFIRRDRELTSRIDSARVTEALDELFLSYSDDPNVNRSVDLCLATNMIQVGLDVTRLGLMAVVGQPKMTSEYIQATSRVGRGRKSPGLVVTIYNPGRPRDRSHFEHFRSYHESIYRWVEPTSVTPFAVPVRERALHAQLITLARYWGKPALRDCPQPAPEPLLFDRIKAVIMRRVLLIDPGEAPATERMLNEFIADWNRVPPSKYGTFGYNDLPVPLMYPSGSMQRVEWNNQSSSTPTSMRNVDQECHAEPITDFLRPG